MTNDLQGFNDTNADYNLCQQTNSNDATLNTLLHLVKWTCAFHSWVLVRIVAPFIERLLSGVAPFWRGRALYELLKKLEL